MQNNLFTIVTVTYNSSKWVKEAIESVLSVNYDKDFEYIISDDCSTDNTWDIIQSYKDSRIKAFRMEKNIGEYPNRNFALYKATGKYLLFVDGDDVLFADTLTRLDNYVTEFPQAGSIWGIPAKQYVSFKLPCIISSMEMIRLIYLANIRVEYIGFYETLFKVSSLRKLNGFSEKYICGDTHMKKWLALEEPVLLVEDGMMYWRPSPGQASATTKTNYNGYRNNVEIDRDILSKLKSKDILKIDRMQIEKNINIRNMKLWVKHTLKKGKFLDAIRLFRQMQFKIIDLKYLFQKGKYVQRDKF